jgi:very-long-chain (3R)-3-hydroxyacyl-CoA dehydratase
MVPYFLLWLRYSTFIVLYITGVSSELLLCYFRLPFLSESKIFNLSLPNKYNFAFDSYYFSIIAMISYIPGFPSLYGYMFAQRKKLLGKKVDEKKKN